MNSPYNGRFKVTQAYKGSEHKGLDLVGLDSKEIHSTVDGIVEIARWENANNTRQGFGQYVMVREYGTDRCFIYAHLSKILVKADDIVHVGTVVGIEGNTGYSFGSHCHYEVREGGINGRSLNVSEISGIPNNEGGIYNDSESQGGYTGTITYQVYDGEWQEEVSKCDNTDDGYAGEYGKPISGIKARCENGEIFIQSHVLGDPIDKWQEPISSKDYYKNNYNSYSGILGKPTDCFRIWCTVGWVKYRACDLNGNYYDWVDSRTKTGTESYAGVYGVPISGIQMY